MTEKGSFAATPPCIGEDVVLAKQAIMEDFDAGRSVPLSVREVPRPALAFLQEYTDHADGAHRSQVPVYPLSRCVEKGQ